MLPRIKLEPTSLRQRHDEAPAQTATHEDGHNAEVQNHGGPRIIMLDAGDARVFDLDAIWRSWHHLHGSPLLRAFLLRVFLLRRVLLLSHLLAAAFGFFIIINTVNLLLRWLIFDDRLNLA